MCVYVCVCVCVRARFDLLIYCFMLCHVDRRVLYCRVGLVG